MAEFIEEAIVLSIQNKKSEVKLITADGCESKSCPLANLCGKEDIIVEAENSVNAREGQRVKIKIEAVNYYKALFLVFILPIIFILSGYFLGIKIPGNKNFSYIFIILGLILWIFILKFSGKFYCTKYKIIEVLK